MAKMMLMGDGNCNGAADGGLHGVGGGDGNCGDYGNREMLVIG